MLYSQGYLYTLTHNNSDTINWRCQQRKCGGRCKSGLDNHTIVIITTPHNHTPNVAEYEVLVRKKNLKQIASSDNRVANRRTIRASNSQLSTEALALVPSYEATRKQMARVRIKKEFHSRFDSRKEIIIPREYMTTFSKERFFWDDSQDEDRILIFTTQNNLNILDKYHDWLADGTFDIAPRLYKQIFSIHVKYKSN